MQTLLWFEASATHPIGPVPPLKHRTVFWRDGDAKPELASKPWSLRSEIGRFTETAERYCYSYAVQNVMDGSERVWEGCLDHGDLPALESRDRSPEEIGAATFICLEPPEGLEREWCEQSARLCSGERIPRPTEEDCDNVASRCAAYEDGEDESADPDAGTDSPDPRPARKHDWGEADRGCSIHGPTDARSQPLLFATAIAALLLRRRANRKRTGPS